MRRVLIALALSLLTTGIGPALAKELCGQQVLDADGQRQAVIGDITATCRPDGSCAAMTFAGDTSAPDTWSARLSLEHNDAKAPWRVRLAVRYAVASLQDGMVLKVDDNEDMAIPYEFLGNGNTDHDYMIDERLTRPISEQLLAGKTVTWHFVPKRSGEGTATFKLDGLQAALDWIACAQGVNAKP